MREFDNAPRPAKTWSAGVVNKTYYRATNVFMCLIVAALFWSAVIGYVVSIAPR